MAQAFPSFSLSLPNVDRSAKTTTVRKMRIDHGASEECNGIDRWPKGEASLFSATLVVGRRQERSFAFLNDVGRGFDYDGCDGRKEIYSNVAVMLL